MNETAAPAATVFLTASEAFARNGVFCRDGLLNNIGLTSVGVSFVSTWLAFSLVAVLAVVATSGPLFYFYYWPAKVTYEKWSRKSNPEFPSPEKVRDEIIQMLKGVMCAAICPAGSVWLANRGLSKAYCGAETPIGDGWAGVGFHAWTFVWVLVVSDFWEFYYHYLGHTYKIAWEQHKHHHKFFNPSPFAVIADEFVDQFFRSMPLALFPVLVPINMDLMFFEYGVFFYAYGCYLHWGYESDWIDAHHPFLNTAFQHYCHHARAIIGKPYHCGFFFKIWDQLFDACYKGECFCCKCERAKGRRTREQYQQVVIPEYELLLQPRFWLGAGLGLLKGASSDDLNEYNPELAKKKLAGSRRSPSPKGVKFS